jgi:hypothetical protein
MRENFTVLFCVLAVFALIVGKSAVPPNLVSAYAAYQSALDRGDMRRAARYGELTLAAAQKSSLLDAAGRARLAAMVATAQVKAGNPERARALYEEAIAGLNDGTHISEMANTKAQLAVLDRVTADRGLRGPMSVSAGSGG